MSISARLSRAAWTGWRIWSRAPLHAAVATTSLALGLGVAVAVFNVIVTLFLAPAVPNGHRLAVVGVNSQGETGWTLVPRVAERLASHSTSFDGLAAERFGWAWLVADRDGVELEGSLVTFNYFDVLGLKPSAGRLFHEDDRDTPPHSVVVISHRLWTEHFGQSPTAVGRTVLINTQPVQILGVAPLGFRGHFQGLARDVWIPHQLDDSSGRGATTALFRSGGAFEVVGRLSDGRSQQQAEAELSALMSDSTPQALAIVRPLRGVHPDARSGPAETSAMALGIAGILLLLVCLNLTGLIVSRNLARRQELAVRRALGATRAGLIVQLCVENMVILVTATALGLAIAVFGQELIARWFTYGFPGLSLAIDGTTVGLILSLGALTTAAFSVIPAIAATRPSAKADIRSQLPGRTASRRRPRVASVLIASQAALSLMLVAGAGLMAESVSSVVSTGGPNADFILHFRVRPSRADYSQLAADTYYRKLLNQLAASPAIAVTALAQVGPSRGSCCPVAVAAADDSAAAAMVENNSVTPEFFDAIGIPIQIGRGFEATDTATSRRVAIVNRALAERLWPHSPSLGRPLRVEGIDYDVIGIAANVHPSRPGEGPVPYAYFNFWQTAQVDARLLVRYRGDVGEALRTIQSALTVAGADVHVGQVGTLTDRLRLGQASTLALANLLRATAIAAVLLSAIGLFGQLSIAAQNRRRDDAIRLALGATRRQIVARVIGDALRILAPAVVIGAGLAWAQGMVLTGYLYGVRPANPLFLIGSALIVFGVGILAAAVPARLVARLQPGAVLHGD